MTSFVLKIIAIISMTMDHTKYVFPGIMPDWFRVVGRMAFPVFAFLVAEGAGKSSNIKKYMRNLALFAIISEIPFDIVGRYEINFLYHTNIYYTLFLAVAAIWAYEELRKRNMNHILSVLLPLLFSVVASILSTDYGAFGVLVIYFVYLASGKWAKFCVLFVFFGLHYSRYLTIRPMFFVGAMAGCLITCFYNGNRGPKLKWMFYIYYPLHLSILSVIRYILKNV